MKLDQSLPKKLAIAVCCHFNESRLIYLDRVTKEFASLGSEVLVTIVTNTSDAKELGKLNSVISGKGFEYQIFTPDTLGHPLLLTWAHFAVFKELLKDESFTHFMYLEDDTLITKENILYWLESRELLRPYSLIPSFLRVEKKANDHQWYSSDCPKPFFIYALPRIKVQENLGFINFPELYQGMYLLDRMLMQEHFQGPSYNPNFGVWGIQEKAAQGVTFLNVPKGYTTRNLIPYALNDLKIDTRCLIHHLPNNYAQPMPGSKAVLTMEVNKLLTSWPTKEFLALKSLKKYIRSRFRVNSIS
ncbi:hypothetical protein [Polynucleobacter sp. MWH-Svant-W18]|uniref:hypothetical protein n=1 Tax=Polynucleobacter sp. MWH-Svant-W18 TaxID=1855909 RepID=UPI001BFE3DF5|nr:hypothetical protein [Polynucleobacter sp. MWH-Svant-W18]QWD78218.1 hypothetical protein C2757_01290 [Polynucleobacter sp. MWH-Svant-W18]